MTATNATYPISDTACFLGLHTFMIDNRTIAQNATRLSQFQYEWRHPNYNFGYTYPLVELVWQW